MNTLAIGGTHNAAQPLKIYYATITLWYAIQRPARSGASQCLVWKYVYRN